MIATKLYIPPPRPNMVSRPRLIERLNTVLQRQLTLISAPAGFGKTTLVSEWIATCGHPVAWLSLDEGDSDPTRFLSYFVAALQMIAPNIGAGVLSILQSPQPPSTEAILTALLNEIAAIPQQFTIVLDDYHALDARAIDDALTFLLKHLPPQMHLVIVTREDPQLPLARLRARNQLTELRVTDLRFTPAEAAGFLNDVMGLSLSAADIAALETRTEGWIAGLQLAALSMQGHQDTASFIKSFTGSHHFVLDYLAEEVLHQQPEHAQTFLLQTSILDRLCGSLCDAVLNDPAVSGQATLEYIERANLFIVLLDNERRWYRYHHLFADLLRQRLRLHLAATTGNAEQAIADLHRRASTWYEENGLEHEAFQHAIATGDIELAARLMEGNGMPLFFRGATLPALNWLKSLPPSMLDARPSLWVMYASVLLFASQTSGVEHKLQAAEAALQNVPPDAYVRDLIGHIASIRATLAVSQNQIEDIIVQSRRALEYLHPDNLPVRIAATWTLGTAYFYQGDHAAARQAFTAALTISERIGHLIIQIMSTIGLGNVQEADTQLHLAAQTYQHVLQLIGEPPLPVACEPHLGLARIHYEWNDLNAAQPHAQQSIYLARQLENTDRVIFSEIFLCRLQLARGDASGAATSLAKLAQSVRQHPFAVWMRDIAALQVLTLIQQGNLTVAAQVAQTHDLPLSQARVHLANGDSTAALAILDALPPAIIERERLKLLVLCAIAHYQHGDKAQAAQHLTEALALAEPNGYLRTFVDEGAPMRQMLSELATSDYIRTLLAAFESKTPPATPLIDALSDRELEVLRLVAQGLSNHEISERLFLALDTVKGHNRRIFDKLHVQRRTEAVARARELGLL